MCRRVYLGTAILIIALLFLPGVLPADEAKAVGTNEWHFSIQPYAWFPTLETDLKFSSPSGSSGSPTVSVEPDDYLENLELAAITALEARKGKWSFTADLIYMKLSSSDSTVKNVDFGGSRVDTGLDIGTDVEMKSFITTFGIGYQVIDTGRFKMDVVAGFRYLWMEPELDWKLSGDVSGPNAGQTFSRSGSHTEDDDILNGIGGIRGHIQLGQSKWFVPFYADIGAGDSDLTWQVFTALGYSFTNKIDAMLGFRHMQFENDDDELIQELRLSGPAFGVYFRF